ncbi:segregation and condensation protein A [Halomonas halmophila]|uniref:Segregation and condensation protein A n=1 Tax=Halomonas halmophila TaxID=252 RepID=A0A4Y4EZ54_9GAMM|nr:ScpA family protein [Halomonas halmophila]GED23282.1 segregation and condensation protein A [Halomonas halmophila]
MSDTPTTADGETVSRDPAPSDAGPDAVTSAAEHSAAQRAASLGRLFDEPITQLPEDLYIPPEALRVFLEAFEGPLDLLLYLIRRQNLDILAIDVASITHQYIEYVQLMKAMEIELAGEYLLMAAMLAEIKSRTLLPRPPKQNEEDEEEDPRAELIRRLQEYERLKNAAESLGDLPRQGRDWFPARAALPPLESRVIHPHVELDELLGALAGILRRAELNQSHQISREVLSTRERMQVILGRLSHEHHTPFESLFSLEEGRAGVVVTFMAILELAKETLIEIVQNAPLSPIHVRARAQTEAVEGDEDFYAEGEEGESPFAAEDDGQDGPADDMPHESEPPQEEEQGSA